MRELKIGYYACGLGATAVGLGLYSYYVRELLVSLALFSSAFLLLALAVVSVLLVWYASERLAIWARLVSRDVMAFSRRLVTATARR